MPPATNSTQALNNLTSLQKNMQDPSQMQTAQEQQLGVPAAQQQVSGLRQAITNTTNLLNQIPSGVMGRTGGSLVTQAQANSQIQNEQAPVSQELNTMGTNLGNQTSDLNTLLSQATTKAGLEEQGQSDKLGLAKDIYTALLGKEQASASQKLEQQKLSEQEREFNLTPQSGSGSDVSSLISALTRGGTGTTGTKSAGASSPQFMVQRSSDKGFNFVNPATGKPINAAQFAQVTKVPFRTLLSAMAAKGDSGAKAALGFVGNDFGYDPGKVAPNSSLAKLYTALTGQQVSKAGPSVHNTITSGIGKLSSAAENRIKSNLKIFGL